MSKIKFLTEKYGITALSNDNLELFISEIYNDGYQAGKGKDKPELRDHFAGLAMQGLMAADPDMGWSEIDCAKYAYDQADVMIAERKKRHQESHEELLCQGDRDE